MIKNATIFKITAEPAESFDARGAIEAAAFVPCGPTQQLSFGFVPPRGIENGALLETIDSQWILRFAIETRKVPADVLDKEVSRIADETEAATGRKPGKKQRKEIREEALLTLLPKAFPQRADTMVWINVPDKFVVIGSTSASAVEIIAAELVRCQDGLAIDVLRPATPAAAAMTQWLTDQAMPEFFQPGSALELKATDESKSKVKYTNHDLFIEEILFHVRGGMAPASMRIEWDDRVHVTLTDKLALKSIDLLEDTRVPPEEAADAWDADVALFTGEIRLLVADLLRAMGGEVPADVTDVEPKEVANGTV